MRTKPPSPGRRSRTSGRTEPRSDHDPAAHGVRLPQGDHEVTDRRDRLRQDPSATEGTHFGLVASREVSMTLPRAAEGGNANDGVSDGIGICDANALSARRGTCRAAPRMRVAWR